MGVEGWWMEFNIILLAYISLYRTCIFLDSLQRNTKQCTILWSVWKHNWSQIFSDYFIISQTIHYYISTILITIHRSSHILLVSKWSLTLWCWINLIGGAPYFLYCIFKLFIIRKGNLILLSWCARYIYRSNLYRWTKTNSCNAALSSITNSFGHTSYFLTSLNCSYMFDIFLYYF